MDKKTYYENLIKLYEATGNTNIGINGSEEVVPQEKIADEGSDVAPQENTAPEGEEDTSASPQQVEDPTMMQQEVPAPDPDFELDKQKSRKLFSLFEDLLNYGSTFLESVKYIDMSLIDYVRFDDYSRYASNIDALVEKIRSYLQHLFTAQSYEKRVYSYVLYRTEMITNIKGIRNVLELNKPNEELEDKSKN